MPNPNKLKATGDKNSGYSNTLKSNNTNYLSNKDKLYSKLFIFIYISLDFFKLCRYLNKDIYKLGNY